MTSEPLTDDAIRAMEAGPALDRLTAEAMGLECNSRPYIPGVVCELATGMYWRPSTDVFDMMAVLSWIRKQVRLDKRCSIWWAKILFDFSNGHPPLQYFIEAADWPETMCKLAILLSRRLATRPAGGRRSDGEALDEGLKG
jgi:hypothetical protein